MTPEQDAAAMLRDIAEAVTEVAERLLDFPVIPGTAGDATTGRK